MLDNFEHLIDAAPVVTELLERCPQLRVLVTSRELLCLKGEHVLGVEPLTVPSHAGPWTPGALDAYSAVSLFVQRATALQVDFRLTNENAGAVVAICQRLDGLPLALELAAARLRQIGTPQTLLSQLAERLPILEHRLRDTQERHQTMTAAIAWSYELLSPTEQLLFARLSVLAGGFSVEAVEAVCNPDGRLPGSLKETVDSLLDKSLVRLVPVPDGLGPRYSMFETIREYAQSQLERDEGSNAVRHAHAKYFLAFARRVAEQINGPHQKDAVSVLELDHENLRAALAWAWEAPDQTTMCLQLVGAIWRFWYVRGHLHEGYGWLERVLERSQGAPAASRIAALSGAGVLAWWLGHYDRAAVWLQECVAIAEGTADFQNTAIAYALLGFMNHFQGRYEDANGLLRRSIALCERASYDWARALGQALLAQTLQCQLSLAEARELAEASLRTFREAEDSWGAALALDVLGSVALHDGNLPLSEARHREALALRRSLNDAQGCAASLTCLARVAYYRNDLPVAHSLCTEALATYRATGELQGISWSLEIMAVILGAWGANYLAAQLWGAAAALRERIGVPATPVDASMYSASQQTLQARLGEAVFRTAWTGGHDMPLPTAIALALDSPGIDAPASTA